MMVRTRRKILGKRLGWVVLLCVAGAAGGCQQHKQKDDGKTYTSDSKGGQDGGSQTGAASGSGGGAKPLNSAANTSNGKESTASDSGTSDATRGQVVAEPGAPVEHDAQKAPRAGSH